MGCCFSRSAGPNSPYPGGTTSGSSRAININPPALAPIPAQSSPHTENSQPTSPASPASTTHRHRRHHQPLDQHINKPLRRHVWASKNRRWTRSRLDRERVDFFDTRVTGRAEMWQTLRAALEVLWNPEAEGAADDGSCGLATAQSILDAAEITLPTGDLAQGAYDNLGNYYAFHEWIVSDPTNIEAETEAEAEAGEQGGAGGEDAKGDIRALDESVQEDDESSTRPEKGKGVADAEDLVTIVARLSEDSRDVSVSVSKDTSVQSVQRKIMEESGLPDDKTIRLAYMGKILNVSHSLEDQGWKEGHIVNALVFTR